MDVLFFLSQMLLVSQKWVTNYEVVDLALVNLHICLKIRSGHSRISLKSTVHYKHTFALATAHHGFVTNK
jgi:hypothetical protein